MLMTMTRWAEPEATELTYICPEREGTLTFYLQIVGSMGSGWSRCRSIECLNNLHDGDTGASVIAKRGEYERDGGRALLKCGG